jgi:predicted esterase
MKTIVLLAGLSAIALSSVAQQKFEGNFPFEGDPAKKYALYEPSSYQDTVPNKLMVAFHPFNKSRWNATTWRDTLTTFAEKAGLILICPDGGSDGMVDDDIDYGFTTALIDSVQKWYNIDASGVFAMGFSVGGKAMYEYGLTFSSVFSGFIPIGPAINGTTEVDGLLSNALCKPFYLIHGENDAPSVRYTPIKGALEQNKAEVNFILMAGVGHTVDFPNRNKILENAFRWIDTVTCKTSTGLPKISDENTFRVYPSIVQPGTSFSLEINLSRIEVLQLEVWSADGKLVHSRKGSYNKSTVVIDVAGFSRGTYFVKAYNQHLRFSQQLVIQ